MLEKTKEVLTDKVSRQLLHDHFSAHCFNECWTLIDKTDRTGEDVDQEFFAISRRRSGPRGTILIE